MLTKKRKKNKASLEKEITKDKRTKKSKEEQVIPDTPADGEFEKISKEKDFFHPKKLILKVRHRGKRNQR